MADTLARAGRRVRTLMVEICASILSADFARLAEEVAAAERGGATVIHVDVMDGHFVPNITIGPPVVRSLRKATRLPLDCHLMIENADELHSLICRCRSRLGQRALRGMPPPAPLLELIAHHGMKPAVVLNPATRVDLVREILPMVHHVLDHEREPGIRRPAIYSLFRSIRSEPWWTPAGTGAGVSNRGRRRGGSRYRVTCRPSRCRTSGRRQRGVRRPQCRARCPRAAGGGQASRRRIGARSVGKARRVGRAASPGGV